MAEKYLKNIRINPVTGHEDYFFPMEIQSEFDREYAELHNLEIGWAKLGYRSYEAIFVPCKEKVLDASGHEIYLDTPSEVQRMRYSIFISDELKRQDATKQDGRCIIPNSHGGVKRCPLRVPNPEYYPGSSLKKTLSVSCENCRYERFRQAHTEIPLSYLDYEDEDGETQVFEVPTPAYTYEADRYEQMKAAFLDFVNDTHPELGELAKLLTEEFNRSEAARELSISTSAARCQREKLKKLCKEFLENAII